MNNTNALESSRPDPEDSEQDESLIQRLRLWLRENISGNRAENLKEALEEVLEEHEEVGQELPEEEQKILKKVLMFGDTDVKDIMTPRTDIKAVEYNITPEELKAYMVHHFHTRVPVYNDTLDNIKGFVHIKDLLPLFAGDAAFNMAFVLREMLFVPPSMKLTDLLVEMRQKGVHMAIVVDEYGGTDGLVTLEDVFEEIVGEIQDEHDEDEMEIPLAWNTQGYTDVDARVKIEKLEKDLGLVFAAKPENTDYETLGGLIFYKLGHVPVAGETVEYEGGIRFEIIAADARSIKKVRVYKS